MEGNVDRFKTRICYSCKGEEALEQLVDEGVYVNISSSKYAAIKCTDCGRTRFIRGRALVISEA
jgi:DNA-directed RNA polymerase subunit RPC12/RpoP